MLPEKVTVCCGLWAGGIIGPYFFQGTANRNVTVNGERYREMISIFFFWPKCKSLTCMTCGFKRRCYMPDSTHNNGLILYCLILSLLLVLQIVACFALRLGDCDVLPCRDHFDFEHPVMNPAN